VRVCPEIEISRIVVVAKLAVVRASNTAYKISAVITSYDVICNSEWSVAKSVPQVVASVA